MADPCDDANASLHAAAHAISFESQMSDNATALKKRIQLLSNANNALHDALSDVDDCTGAINKLDLDKRGLITNSMLMAELSYITPNIIAVAKVRDCKKLILFTAKNNVAQAYEYLNGDTLQGDSQYPLVIQGNELVQRAAAHLSMTLPDTSSARAFASSQSQALADARALDTSDCNSALNGYLPHAVLLFFFSQTSQ